LLPGTSWKKPTQPFSEPYQRQQKQKVASAWIAGIQARVPLTAIIAPMLGEILDGKYRIDKQLGAGGMGNVYLATHLGTTRIVAAKSLAPRWAAEPHFLARFQREAQACGRLRPPNIVNVPDFGIAKSAAGDMPYLVMEFLDGQTLSDFQKEN